mgnify:CR=1 FL=1
MNDLNLLNTFSFVVSFTEIDDVLKILLLAVSIGYTAQRWYLLNKQKNGKNKQ